MSPLKITHKIGDHLRYKFNIFPTLCECSVQHEISKQIRHIIYDAYVCYRKKRFGESFRMAPTLYLFCMSILIAYILDIANKA